MAAIIDTARTRAERAVGEVVFSAVDAFERLIERKSRVGTEPFLSPHDFAWTRQLENGWPAIRAELDQVLSYRDALPNFQDISEAQAGLTDDDQWKTFFLFGYGFRSEPNCARCPATAALLERVPGMRTAFFSILGPRKRIPPHHGPYKGVLRYHLGLKIPDPARCGIRVGGREAHWTEGGSLVFDDTYEHEAWNDSDDVRVVLFMDVLRPLPPGVDALNRLLIRAIALTPFIRSAKRNHLDWEQRFEALRGQSSSLKTPA